MKTATSILSLIALPLVLSACGKYEKNPVPNLEKMREAGKNELVLGPDKPQVIREEIRVEVPVEVIREVERQVPVVVTQTIEQATVDEKYLVIAPDMDMSFTEGRSSSFKIRARVLVPGAKMKLVSNNLPEGASLKDVSTANDPGLYELTWTPALATVPANSARKVVTIKLSAQITETKTEADRQLLEGLVREREVNLSVFRDQSPPTDLKIESLPNEVSEGQIIPFQIIVKVPGIDDKSAQKPSLVGIFDGVVSTPGQDDLERDGTRHLIIDTNKPEVEYLGNQTWKFNRAFDTKNIPAQPQLGKDGQVRASADGVRVRLSFKVYSPNGSSTAQTLKQVRIKYDRPVTAPRFDFSGLGQETLDLIPGERLRLNFYVESSDARAQVKVQIPDLSALIGTPTLTCQASSAGAFRQACSLSWSVPCSAQEKDLKNDIALSAQASFSNTSSETTTAVLKTRLSKVPTTCPAPAPATTEAQ